jgi:hypothetical protein
MPINSPDTPEEPVTFLLMLDGALEASFTRTWTKAGPKGTAYVRANPVEPGHVLAFAARWSLSTEAAEEIIADVETNERFDQWIDLLDYLTEGAKALGVDLKTYAGQYLTGMGTYRPGRA